MEVDTLPFNAGAKSAATILCADCGAPVDGTVSGAFCIDCLKLKSDGNGDSMYDLFKNASDFFSYCGDSARSNPAHVPRL